MRAHPNVTVTRYVTPLREGGSLPAIVEADDDGLYVLKFRGAGQGARALVAELVSGEIARALGLPVPELVFAELDRDLARTEPDPEIHALIHDSAGLNLALDFLPGAVTYDPLVHALDAGPDVAHRVVRRLCHQRRPHRAQHQHADVAPAGRGSSTTARRSTSTMRPGGSWRPRGPATRSRCWRATCCAPRARVLAAVDAALAAALGGGVHRVDPRRGSPTRG